MTAADQLLARARRAPLMRAVAMAAFTLVVGGSPIVATAEQDPVISPNPNPEGETITISENVVNYSEFVNNGSVILPIQIVDDTFLCCRLTNLDQGKLTNSSTGNFDIYGYLYNNSAAIIDNSNLFNIKHTIINEYLRYDAYLLNHGTLNNTSTGSLVNDGSIWNYSTGNITNAGKLGISGSLRNLGGTLTNSDTLRVTGVGVLENTGSADPADSSKILIGTLINSSDSTILMFGGQLLNQEFGSITNRGWIDLAAADPSDPNSFAGSLTNSGKLINEKTITIRSAQYPDPVLPDYGNAALDNRGLLENAQDGSLSVSGNLFNSGILNNAGTLINVVSGKIGNNGTLNNLSGSSLESFGQLDNFGTLNNHGVLTLKNQYALLNGGTLTNSNQLDNYGHIENLGRVENNGNLLNSGGELINFGRFVNNLSGVVSGSGTYYQYGKDATTENYGYMEQNSFYFGAGTIIAKLDKDGEPVNFKAETMYIADNVDVKPGSSPGVMAIDADVTSGGDFFFEIAGTRAGLDYDVLKIYGLLNFIGGHIDIEFIDDFLPILGDSFNFLQVTGDILGWDAMRDNVRVTGLSEGFGWAISERDGGLFFDITAVPDTGTAPEPGTYALVLAGLGLMGYVSRRRRALSA